MSDSSRRRKFTSPVRPDQPSDPPEDEIEGFEKQTMETPPVEKKAGRAQIQVEQLRLRLKRIRDEALERRKKKEKEREALQAESPRTDFSDSAGTFEPSCEVKRKLGKEFPVQELQLPARKVTCVVRDLLSDEDFDNSRSWQDITTKLEKEDRGANHCPPHDLIDFSEPINECPDGKLAPEPLVEEQTETIKRTKGEQLLTDLQTCLGRVECLLQDFEKSPDFQKKLETVERSHLQEQLEGSEELRKEIGRLFEQIPKYCDPREFRRLVRKAIPCGERLIAWQRHLLDEIERRQGMKEKPRTFEVENPKSDFSDSTSAKVISHEAIQSEDKLPEDEERKNADLVENVSRTSEHQTNKEENESWKSKEDLIDFLGPVVELPKEEFIPEDLINFGESTEELNDLPVLALIEEEEIVEPTESTSTASLEVKGEEDRLLEEIEELISESDIEYVPMSDEELLEGIEDYFEEFEKLSDQDSEERIILAMEDLFSDEEFEDLNLQQDKVVEIDSSETETDILSDPSANSGPKADLSQNGSALGKSLLLLCSEFIGTKERSSETQPVSSQENLVNKDVEPIIEHETERTGEDPARDLHSDPVFDSGRPKKGPDKVLPDGTLRRILDSQRITSEIFGNTGSVPVGRRSRMWKNSDPKFYSERPRRVPDKALRMQRHHRTRFNPQQPKKGPDKRF